MRVGVITTVSGRKDHLINQHRGLGSSSVAPHCYVVVAMNEPTVREWLPRMHPHPEIVTLSSPDHRLPVAEARNLGARRAIELSADLLVFLDVDCVPAPELIAAYSAAAQSYPDSLLGGAVGYLPETVSAFDDRRSDVALFHKFRPRLSAGEVQPADPALFWSLSFALSVDAWAAVGGFHEEYRGYGGEDTDFAQTGLRAQVPFRWVGGAEAFHQYHETQSPPVQHLDDILANGRIFARRWGFWPMTGWLSAFEDLGLVARDPLSGDWIRASPSTSGATSEQEEQKI
jgi:N-acetylglucosaminyl-diphospho-decaprenol L-rhamnosyltransferase